MSQFAPKYTPEQRRAAVSALLDRGMTAPQVAAAAADGYLGVPPFRMPVGTLYRLAREERQRRERARLIGVFEESPAEVAEEMVLKGFLVLEEEFRQMSAATARGKPLDLDRFGAASRCTDWLVRASLRLKPRARPAKEPDRRESEFERMLRREHEATAKEPVAHHGAPESRKLPDGWPSSTRDPALQR